MLPRDVGRYLERWGYHPIEREDFGGNFLSVRIAQVEEQGQHQPGCAFVSLCAVPRGSSTERVEDLPTLADWLEPNARQYEPPGIFLPFRNEKRFTSQGILLWEEGYRSQVAPRKWASYLLVARDGYVEYGRQGGAPLNGRTYHFYVPIVAWIQRFAAFIAELRSKMEQKPDYWMVLNLTDSEDACLCTLGDGWREPWDRLDASWPPRCLESRIQISRTLEGSEEPLNITRWFAERIANALGNIDSFAAALPSLVSTIFEVAQGSWRVTAKERSVEITRGDGEAGHISLEVFDDGRLSCFLELRQTTRNDLASILMIDADRVESDIAKVLEAFSRILDNLDSRRSVTGVYLQGSLRGVQGKAFGVLPREPLTSMTIPSHGLADPLPFPTVPMAVNVQDLRRARPLAHTLRATLGRIFGAALN